MSAAIAYLLQATASPTEEAAYFVRQSGVVAILTASTALELGSSLEDLVQKTHSATFTSISIKSALLQSHNPIPVDTILISSDRYLDDNGPGLVIFTSGTTGPPKGAVMRRAYLHDGASAVAGYYGVTEEDVLLSVLPVHHATGIGINVFPFLVSGACIEFRSGGFDPEWMWNRWKQGGLTFFSGVPTIYMRMMRYYQQHLSELPAEDLTQYVRGAQQLRACLCGTSALPFPIADFWAKLTGRRILQRYGASEFGAIFKVSDRDTDCPDGTVGEAVPGVDVKLSEGDKGEVLVRSPWMFSGYINDSDATARAHTDEGYYKTGDIAYREGKYYFIVGRASLDIIKSGGYKISALDVEREILSLPYIQEAMVVGVPDEELGQRVAVAVTLREEELDARHGSKRADGVGHMLTMPTLRQELRSRLAGYKMPTLLRIVEGELPKTATGKVMKRVLGPQLFPPNYRLDPGVQVWHFSSKPAASL